MTRRWLALAFLLVAFSARVALAQVTLGGSGTGPLIISSGASSAATNTSSLVTIFTYTVPSGLAQGNFTPLHLHMAGIISTNNISTPNGVGAVNVACNYGGANASISLSNNNTLTPATALFPPNLSSTPIFLDVWVSGYAAPQSNGIVESITGQLYIASRNSTNVVMYASATQAGTVAVSSANALACTWNWVSATSTNSVIFHNATLSAP